jgi:16S rRNA (adenine1518-N6/adenine1519-N6)-dimethyltransferase
MLEWPSSWSRSAPSSSPRSDRTIIGAAISSPREILDRYGIVPRKRHGQNFLHDPAVARRIVKEAGVGPRDRVVEIGPGLGAMTRPLLEEGARVTAIEIDPRIAGYLRDTLGEKEEFDLLEGDVLEVDWNSMGPEPWILVANLPYSITGPLLERILAPPAGMIRAILMVQKEVAARLTAKPEGKEIGAVGVFAQLLFSVERLFDVGAGAFHPPPEIVSTVLRLQLRSDRAVSAELRDAVNRAFRHRRKMIRKTLQGMPASEPVWGTALEAIGRSPNARPEELAPEDWPRLLAAVADGGEA